MRLIRCMTVCVGVALLAALPLCTSSGGGADVGNPLYGTVVNYSSGGPRASGAMVVLAKLGVDPGLDGPAVGIFNDDSRIIVTPIYFDTAYTDFYGRFKFEAVRPADYAITASYHGLLALQYVEQRASQDGEVELCLAEPTTVRVRPYDPIDTSGVYFRDVQVAGTGFVARADAGGVMVLDGVPAGELILKFYRSDSVIITYPSFRTNPGCEAELEVDPVLPWTPRPCGDRDPRGRPFIMDAYIPVLEGGDGIFRDGRKYDVRISFSLDMDALSIENGMHCFSRDSSATLDD